VTIFLVTECQGILAFGFFLSPVVSSKVNKNNILARVVVIFLMSLPSVGRAAGAADNGVHVLQSDASGCVIEYVPLYHTENRILSNGVATLKLRVDGGIPLDRQLPGAPQLYERSILVRFGGSKGNSVEIIKTEYDDSSNVTLTPVPAYQTDGVGPVSTFTINAAEYSKTGMIPEQLVSLSGVGESRGIFLGHIEVIPYQYNPALRVLRRFKRIVVRVGFGPAEQTHPVRMSPARIAVNDRLPAAMAPPPTPRAVTLQNSVLASGSWYRIAITVEGMYKISGQALLNAGLPASTDPKTIKIYGNGGSETPLSVSAPAVDDLLTNADYVYDGGTPGQLDAADYVIFYGKPANGWTYEPVSRTYSHYINRFSVTNYYWLTSGGSPANAMTVVPSLNDPSAFSPSTAIAKLFREDENENILASGLNWLGQVFNSGDQMAYVHQLPGLDVTQPIFYRFDIGAQSNGSSQFTVQEHSTSITAVTLPATYTSGDAYYGSSQFINRILPVSMTPNQINGFNDGQSRLRFLFSSSSSGGVGYIDWYELAYHRLLAAQNDLFNFSSYDTTATIQYRVSGFSGGPVMVFDISRFDSVLMIANSQIVADTCTFQIQQTGGRPRQLFVVGPNGFRSPGSLTRVANQNLHGTDPGAAYIIITHNDFLAAAQRLQTFRQQTSTNPLSTVVVDVDQIYNEFGGGLLTPVAIRNYLRYAYQNWAQPPLYLLLFGDGDYDYRRIIATGTDWIPPWETDESFVPINTFSSDDEFAVFNTADVVDMAIGRLPARSATDAEAMVTKIIQYETHAVADDWKSRFTFVADDGPAGLGGAGGVIDDGFLHTEQAEAVSQLVPALFDITKIYEYAYPTIEAAGGRRKPDVNAAIDNQINQGTLLLNYTGHGNPHLWADEHVFTVEGDFGLLHNTAKYFFLVAATCNFSNFDAITPQSGGEQLVEMPSAGAIAVFSATRPVLSFANFALNETLYGHMLTADSLGRIIPQRLGDIVYETKQERTTDNDRKYFLLGDPALTLAYPKLYASIDSVNHIPGNQVVQLKALERSTISARVRDTSQAFSNAFNGTAEVVVFDASHGVTLTDPDPYIGSFTYVAAGTPLFRGQASMIAGAMNVNFVVPKDIAYSNNNGRISLYFSNAVTDGYGYTSNILINGTDTTAAADAVGPQVHLYIDNRGFRSGDVVSGSPTLIADLFDSSGINTSNAGIGHGIEAWLDDQSQSIDVSGYYKSKTDTYREGTVEYPLGPLAEGSHKLRFRAWDTYDNPASSQTVFDVLTSVGLQLTSVFNFPNPMSSSTLFTFQHNQVSIIDAEVKIYTVAGRMIRDVKKTGITTQFVQIPWDGRDKDGDAIANGVYLYKVSARTEDGRFTSEAFGKLSVVK